MTHDIVALLKAYQSTLGGSISSCNEDEKYTWVRIDNVIAELEKRIAELDEPNKSHCCEHYYCTGLKDQKDNVELLINVVEKLIQTTTNQRI